MLFLEETGHYFAPYYFGTLVAAAFGSFAGAWATSRRETKRAVIAELNSVSAARALSFSICNRFMALKRQHIRPLQSEYAEARARFTENQLRGRPNVLQADMRALTPVWLPTEALERQIFEKTSVRGRAVAAAVDLVGVIDGLNIAVRTRNELVSEIQRQSPWPALQLAERYFGLRTADGVIDDRIQTNIAALFAQTDDCIFFSKILADDLFKYGTRLRRRNSWKFRLGVPKEVPEDWTFAQREKLLPDEAQYANWLRGFPKKPTRVEEIKKRLGSILAEGRRPPD